MCMPMWRRRRGHIWLSVIHYSTFQLLGCGISQKKKMFHSRTALGEARCLQNLTLSLYISSQCRTVRWQLQRLCRVCLDKLSYLENFTTGTKNLRGREKLHCALLESAYEYLRLALSGTQQLTISKRKYGASFLHLSKDVGSIRVGVCSGMFLDHLLQVVLAADYVGWLDPHAYTTISAR